MTDHGSGWANTTVGELLKIRYGKALPTEERDPTGPVPVVGSAGRMTGTHTALVTSPAVLIGRKGSAGAVRLESDGCWPIDTTYYAEIPDTCDPRFLRWQLHALELGRLDSSTTTPSLRREDLEAQPMVVPPFDEQRRIVDILENHLSRLEAAENYLTSGLRRAEGWHQRLLASTLWSADCPRARIQELLREPMRSGRSDRAATGGESGTRTLTLTAVTKNAFTEANTKITVTTPDRARDLWLKPGDVFVQRANTPELVGTTARYDGPPEWAIFPDLLIRLRADEDKIDSRFLTAALQSKPGHDQLRRKAKGLAGSMPKIDQSAIADTTIPLPPVDVQLRLLAITEDAANALALLRAELASAQRRSRVLRRALLEAAFSGRLTGNASDQSEAEEMINA